MPITHEPHISHRGLRRGLRYMKLFVDSYFPFHGLSLEDWFDHAPTLTFIESTIYQLDDFLEQSQRSQRVTPVDAFERVRERIAGLLQELGCYDDGIAFELQEMVDYCVLETRLMTPGAMPSPEDLRRASELRTIDLRLLHRTLFRLRGKPYDEALIAMIRPVEALWDIELDFTQYADDIRDDSFNIYRMYVRAYAERAPAAMAAAIDVLQTEVRERLAALPEATQQIAREVYRRYRATEPRPPMPEPDLAADPGSLPLCAPSRAAGNTTTHPSTTAHPKGHPSHA